MALARCRFRLSTAASTLLMTVSITGQSDSTATVQRFVGAFRLVSFVTYDDGLNPTPSPYTEGVIMYDASGRMGVHLLDPRRTGREDGGYIAYFGGYEVDPAEGVVRHLIEGSTGIGAGNRTAVRHFRFEDAGNTLVLEVRNDGRVGARLHWERYR